MTNSINTLIRKYLSGDISENEYRLLSETIANDKNAAKHLERITDADDLTKRYAEYASVDTKAALQKFIEQYINEHETDVVKSRIVRILSPRFYRIAAVILVLLIGGAFWYHREYTRVTPPVISQEVQMAMEQSIQSGKQDADIVSLSDELRVKGEKSDGNEELRMKNEESISENASEYSSLSTLQASLTKEQLLAAKRITTRHDKEFWVTLDDGTLVHLNYNTRLIYPEKFGRGDRNVILDGEAYFMVAKDKSRPFVVHTPQGDVKVYGTEFYVKTGSGNTSSKTTDEDFSVVLVQGSIGFKQSDSPEQSLQPGQQLSIFNHQMSVTEIDPSPYVAWNEGTFVFKNWSLERILNVLSLWYDKDIVFAKENLKDINLSGNFYRYSSLEPSLKALEKVAGVRIAISGKKITIDN